MTAREIAVKHCVETSRQPSRDTRTGFITRRKECPFWCYVSGREWCGLFEIDALAADRGRLPQCKGSVLVTFEKKTKRQRRSAADRALAALEKHGSLVRDPDQRGWWCAPIHPSAGVRLGRGSHVCGSATISKLVAQGKVALLGGGEEAVLVEAPVQCFCIVCQDELLLEPPHCERCTADARDYTEEQIAACFRVTGEKEK